MIEQAATQALEFALIIYPALHDEHLTLSV